MFPVFKVTESDEEIGLEELEDDEIFEEHSYQPKSIAERFSLRDSFYLHQERWLVAGFFSVMLIMLVTPVALTIYGVKEAPVVLENNVDHQQYNHDYKDEFDNKAQHSFQHGSVAADHPKCSEVGVTILKEGGNAIDASIASTICQGVLRPYASGIGGGCVIMIRLANGTNIIIDGRETAPLASYETMFVNKSKEAKMGAKAGATPGELKALETAWKLYGSGNITWERLFQESIQFAREGFVLDSLFEERLESNKTEILEGNLHELFSKSREKLLKEGDVLKFPELANTLETIAKEGTDAFYYGEIGRKFVEDIQNAGGILTESDLANYTIKFREVIGTYYQGHKVMTAPPPFGGAILIQALNLLEFYNLPALFVENEYPQALHWIVESLKLSYSNRMGLGDPEFVDMSYLLPYMLSKDHASSLRSRLSPNQVFPPQHYIDLVNITEIVNDGGTMHLSVVDSQRNAVALTSTVNLNFGALWYSSQTGIILNDEMDDFSTFGISNAFQYPPSKANYIAPGKRPLSSMTPTIVTKNEELEFVMGGSGGSAIPTAVLQTLLNIVAFNKNVDDAIHIPRIHCQWIPNMVLIEPKFRYDQISYQKLEKVGNHMMTIPFAHGISAVQAIQVAENNTLFAASDRRKGGLPFGY